MASNAIGYIIVLSVVVLASLNNISLYVAY